MESLKGDRGYSKAPCTEDGWCRKGSYRERIRETVTILSGAGIERSREGC